MSEVMMCQCDGCGKRVANRNEAPGWLRIEGSVSRSRGVYLKRPGCWGSSFVRDKSDWCSVECLASKLDTLGRVVRPKHATLTKGKDR